MELSEYSLWILFYVTACFLGRFQSRKVPFYVCTHDRPLVLVQVQMISAIPVFIGSVSKRNSHDRPPVLCNSWQTFGFRSLFYFLKNRGSTFSLSSWSPACFYQFSKWLKSCVLERDQWGILSRVYCVRHLLFTVLYMV